MEASGPVSMEIESITTSLAFEPIQLRVGLEPDLALAKDLLLPELSIREANFGTS